MELREFFRAHQESLLVILAVAFVAVLVGYILWGIAALTSSFASAVTVSRPEAESASFHFSQAKALNLKGIPVPQ